MTKTKFEAMEILNKDESPAAYPVDEGTGRGPSLRRPKPWSRSTTLRRASICRSAIPSSCRTAERRPAFAAACEHTDESLREVLGFSITSRKSTIRALDPRENSPKARRPTETQKPVIWRFLASLPLTSYLIACVAIAPCKKSVVSGIW